MNLRIYDIVFIFIKWVFVIVVFFFLSDPKLPLSFQTIISLECKLSLGIQTYIINVQANMKKAIFNIEQKERKHLQWNEPQVIFLHLLIHPFFRFFNTSWSHPFFAVAY